MSADNWTKCPACKVKAQEKQKELEQKLNDGYGKLSKEDYQLLVDQVKTAPPELEDTLREDYEIGIYGDRFFVNYKGRCQKCGWLHEYKWEDRNLVKIGG